MLGLYEKTKLGITRRIPKLKIFSFIVQMGVDINNWTHHMGRMEPSLLPRPFMIFICKGRRVIGLPKKHQGSEIERSGGLKTFTLVTTLFMWMAYQHLRMQLRWKYFWLKQCESVLQFVSWQCISIWNKLISRIVKNSEWRTTHLHVIWCTTFHSLL